MPHEGMLPRLNGALTGALNPCDPQFVAQVLAPRAPRHASLVDIGCGRGATLAWLSEHSDYALHGVEPDKSLIAEARENCPAATIALAGADALPFGDSTFDAALMECVFSLLDAPLSAIDELSRVIRPQCALALTDLYSRSGIDLDVRQSSSLLGHVYAKATIDAFFEGGGFKLETFIDRTADMGTMMAQMIMDGAAGDCLDDETIKLLRRAKAGYGIWIWKNSGEGAPGL
jgi:ubiquinone/menaquinone biosynthesis C-methylase UbiE